MQFENRKIELIHWITQLEDPKMIEKLEVVKDEDESFWDTLPPEIKERILQSKAEMEAGQFVSHEEVMAKYSKYLK